MDLRDELAIRFAAALVALDIDDRQIPRRAYDLAEALLAERAARIDAEEARAIAAEQELAEDPEPWLASHPMLLDEPWPMEEEPAGEEELDERWAGYDPSWDQEPRWAPESPRKADSVRPGLARTRPEADDDKKERIA